MSDVIYLVQNDTLPTLFVSLTDELTGLPVDLSTATQVQLMFRQVGSLTLTDTLVGTLLPGMVNPDGSITTTGYTVAGTGGRFSAPWNPTTLAGVGQYEASITITFPGGLVLTVYETLRFFIRASF